MIDAAYVIFGVGSIATVSAAWGATRSHVAEIRKDLKKHEADDQAAWIKTEGRLSSLETLTREIHRVVVKD
jgi:hypothetical protein